MSKQLDLSDPTKLSDEDLQYALSRGKLPQDVVDSIMQDPERRAAATGNLFAPTPIEDQVHTGTINSAGLTQAEYDRAVELLRQEQGGDDDEEDEGSGEPEDYDEGWNNDDRRAELSRRGLPVEGNKDELIARLLADDAEDEDTEGS